MRRGASILAGVITLLGAGGVVGITSFDASATDKAIRLTVPKALPQAIQGKAYSYSFADRVVGGTGPPYVWKLTGNLPLGLRFNQSSGRITGTISETAKTTIYVLRICATGAKRVVSGTQPVNTACAATRMVVSNRKPPADMTGINDHAGMFSTGLDPAVITLGPKVGNKPDLPTYSGQTGLVVELADGDPVLAPLDMRFVGFNNRNSDYRIATNGTRQEPFDDLELCFESTSADWPGLIFCVYHMQNSPLLLGLNLNPSCGNAVEWPGPLRAEGLQVGTNGDKTIPGSTNSMACKALLGRAISRGSVIAYAGRVGPHAQAPMRIKVWDPAVNPLVTFGDKHLHWVQPDVFFYWKCFAPQAEFAPGVLAYPFECDGYQVPAGQRSVEFKYAP